MSTGRNPANSTKSRQAAKAAADRLVQEFVRVNHPMELTWEDWSRKDSAVITKFAQSLVDT